MQHKIPVCLALTGLILRIGLAHGIPTPLAIGPLHVQSNAIVDSTGQVFRLRGVEMPGLNIANPTTDKSQSVDALNATTFGILRLRWNLNAVRVPVSAWIWRRDGQSYLDRAGKIVRAATAAGLVVVLSDYEDASSGETSGLGLPTSDSVAFWTTWAAYFKDDPHVILGAFNDPSISLVPGQTPGQRSSSDWQFWLQGGMAQNGHPAAGMQALVDAIRSAGAAQVIAVCAFSDALDFQGFGPDSFVRDANTIYEVHPFFDHALTDDDRDRNFGVLARSVPVYAGRWGLDLTADEPSCHSVPQDPQAATDLLFQTFAYFDSRGISWTTSSFAPHSLVQNVSTFEETKLDRTWTCGTITDPQPGMGQVQLLWLTGDPMGFGVLVPELIASGAGGPSAPVAPGEIIVAFGFLFGPDNNSMAAFDDSGQLPTTLDGIRMLFDGEAAPLFSTGPYEISVQVPYSVQGKAHVNVQLFYRDIPSNIAQLSVMDAVPGIVTNLGTNQALAVNADGTLNSASNPAASGSVVALYATGYGQTSPPGVTGHASQAPAAQPMLSVGVTINNASADVLYAAEAAGYVGLLQVNTRVPGTPSGGKARTVPVVLMIGSRSSIPGVTLWVQ